MDDHPTIVQGKGVARRVGISQSGEDEDEERRNPNPERSGRTERPLAVVAMHPFQAQAMAETLLPRSTLYCIYGSFIFL